MAIVDYNKITACQRVNLEPLVDKFRAFNWKSYITFGESCSFIKRDLKQQYNKPFILVADTIKGKGVSFMEDSIEWHYKNLTKELLDKALKENE